MPPDVLRNFYLPLKIRRLRPGLNPRTWYQRPARYLQTTEAADESICKYNSRILQFPRIFNRPVMVTSERKYVRESTITINRYQRLLGTFALLLVKKQCTNTRIVPNFNILRTGLLNCLNARSRGLNFRHRASCIQGQAFRYSPENAFCIFNQQIYFII